MRSLTAVDRDIRKTHEALKNEYDKGYLNIDDDYIASLWARLDELRVEKWHR